MYSNVPFLFLWLLHNEIVNTFKKTKIPSFDFLVSLREHRHLLENLQNATHDALCAEGTTMFRRFSQQTLTSSTSSFLTLLFSTMAFVLNSRCHWVQKVLFLVIETHGESAGSVAAW